MGVEVVCARRDLPEEAERLPLAEVLARRTLGLEVPVHVALLGVLEHHRQPCAWSGERRGWQVAGGRQASEAAVRQSSCCEADTRPNQGRGGAGARAPCGMALPAP